MNASIDHARAVAELGLMEPVLADGGRDVLLDEDAAQLVVRIDDEEGRVRLLTISFVPFGEPGESALRLVRFDVTLPFAVAEGNDDDVAAALPVIDRHLALGRFTRDLDGSLHLRYTLALDASSVIGDDALVELVELLDFQQERFGDYVEGVCEGEVAVEVLDSVIAAGEA